MQQNYNSVIKRKIYCFMIIVLSASCGTTKLNSDIPRSTMQDESTFLKTRTAWIALDSTEKYFHGWSKPRQAMEDTLLTTTAVVNLLEQELIRLNSDSWRNIDSAEMINMFDYYLQFIEFKDSTGQHYVFVNALCEKCDCFERFSEIYMASFDGGDCFFEAIVDVKNSKVKLRSIN
jgi:hypothetical protein